MCKLIERANIFKTKKTAKEIFNYSSTGELFMIHEWYEIAKNKLKKEAKIEPTHL